MYWSGWLRGFVALTPATHFWMFTSVLFGSSPRSYSFTSAAFPITFHRGGLRVQRVAKIFPTCDSPGSRSAWCSFIPLQKFALKSLFCLVADPGEGTRGPFPLPLLIFRPNWWPKENAPLPLSQGVDDPPPPPREGMDPPLLLCEEKPYPVWFWFRCKSIQFSVNIALASLFLSGPWIISVWQNSCDL